MVGFVDDGKNREPRATNSGTDLPKFLTRFHTDNKQDFDAILGEIKSRDKSIREETFEKYLSIISDGFKYAIDTYGPTTMPKGGVIFALGVIDTVTKETLISRGRGFVTGISGRDNSIVYTFGAVAEDCQQMQAQQVLTNSQLQSLGYATSAEGYVFINSVEEAYHCYQDVNNLDKVPGGKKVLTLNDRSHPREVAIVQVLDKLIKSGNFKYPLYPLHDAC